MRKLLLFTAFCGCMLVQLTLVAQTYTFTGSGNWSNSARWTCTGVGCSATNVPPNPITSGSSVTISGNCTLNTSRTINSGASLTVSLLANLTINSGRTLRNNGTVTNGGNITNTGTIVQNGTFINNKTISNSGALNLNGGTLSNNSGATLTNTITITFNNGNISNAGNVNNQPGATVQVDGNGVLVGAGNFYNDGILSLANNTIKTFTIGGNYYSSSTSILNLDIRAGGSDALAISGIIVLDGTLNLTINNASTVTEVDRFDLIIGSPITGSFSTTNLPGNLSDWDVIVDANGYLYLEYNGAPLPIELLSFTGTPQNNAIELKWKTATETNNAYMAVEYSKDGIQFVEIGQRKGAGSSLEAHTYSFTDINPFTGINYYRLRQVDLDGKSTYHNIIAVKYEGKSAQGIKVVPTLVNSDFTLVSESPMLAGSTIQIVDTKGSVIQHLQIDAETNQKIINVAALPTGIYFATVKTGNILQTLRFIRL